MPEYNGIKKLMILDPPFYRLYREEYSIGNYPLALGYLAGEVLRKTDWEVQTYSVDFRSNHVGLSITHMTGEGYREYLTNLKDPGGPVWAEVRSALADYNPTVIGISVKSQTLASARMIARLAKEHDPKILVVVGGPHPSMVRDEVLACPEFDICVVGEGEETLVDLLEAWESGRDLGRVKGLCYRREGRIEITQPRPLIEDLDSLTYPHLTAPQVLRGYELHPVHAFAEVFAVRGCPFNCFYCGSRMIWTRKVRYRSVANVIDEIRRLMALGVKRVRFSDDTFGVDKRYIRALCRALIEDCPGLTWHCELHVNLVERELIQLMYEAGCRLVQLGIESGNDEILKAMRKRTTIAQAIEACRVIKAAGITLQAFFMIGFPQETEESLADTVKAMKECGCDTIIYSIFTPYPGTEMFNYCLENGLIPEGYDPSLYNHQSPANNFSRHIPHERFRDLATQVEVLVEELNSGPSPKAGSGPKSDRSAPADHLSYPRYVLRRVMELGPAEVARRLARRVFGG